ncbi:MAG: hemolysin family protein, partial [Bacteroidota bacterium]
IIVGEQVPKIYAIRKPSPVFLYSAWLLRAFYVLLYPFMWVLNKITLVVLRWVGVEDPDGHDAPLSEEEIRHNLSLSHAHGELTKNEHRLLNAVFRFDDEVARHIMVPRSEVDYLDANLSFAENLAHARKSPHTRFPLCDSSLDVVLGVLHIKDFLGHDADDSLDLKKLVRPPLYIPENMPIGQLMQEFRTARQHFAFIQDEHGTTLGTVTLEDVLEELVGSVQDEFDQELPEISPEGDNQYLVDGRLLLENFNEKFGTELVAEDADTLSGYLVEQAGHKIKQGQKIELAESWVATLVEVKGIRAKRIRISQK